jgi:hypothetical protein
MKQFASIFLIGTFLLSQAGCREIGVMTGEENATGRERVTWDADLGEINPPSPERRTIYVQFNDATGRDIQMRTELRDELTKQGYQIVANPDTANYKLQLRLTSFDRREAGDRTDGTGRTVAHGSAGAAADASGSGLLGNLVGRGVLNRANAKEWCLVANFTLAEFVPEGVETNVHSSTVNQTASRNGAGNASGATGGTRNTTDGASQNMTYLKNHIEYRRTLTASTTQTGLEEQEALDRLLPRLLKAAANALPSAL